MTGTAGQKRLPKDFFARDPIPLPPLAEQHRIVQKVDELMALCDRLEQQTHDQHAAHETLVDTLLDTLAQSPDATELANNWARLAAHFDTLFTTEHSINRLKQTILQLALTGQLARQELNDEPADQLLAKIVDEKERLLKNVDIKSKKPKRLPDSSDQKPLMLPQNWTSARLIDLIHIRSGDGLTSSNMVQTGNIPVFGGNGITGNHDESNVSMPTLVIGRVGYYCGSVHVTPDRAWVTDNAFITIFPDKHLDIEFLYWLLSGTNLKEQDNATAQPVISGRKIYPIVVALPPISEQHRIVEKIDELMFLCDQLKTRVNQASKTRRQMANAVVEQALH